MIPLFLLYTLWIGFLLYFVTNLYSCIRHPHFLSCVFSHQLVCPTLIEFPCVSLSPEGIYVGRVLVRCTVPWQHCVFLPSLFLVCFFLCFGLCLYLLRVHLCPLICLPCLTAHLCSKQIKKVKPKNLF